MDRTTGRAGGLAAILAATLGVAAQAGDLPLRAARWVAPERDLVGALTHRPAECLPAAKAGTYEIEIGRAAFRTPMLLGGQAARQGLACDTCHPNGRRNSDFHFPGLSDAAGTVDVTNALFSKTRDDGIFNPKPIPDLSAPKDRLKVDQSGPALADFIHGLITEEFDGPEPPASVMRGVVAYVRALDPDACGHDDGRRLRLAEIADDAMRAVKAARQALEGDDRDAAQLMIAAARSELGLIHERFSASDRADDRQLLSNADSELAGIAAALRAKNGQAATRIAHWLQRAPERFRSIARDESYSLFDPVRLTAALKD